MPRKIQSITWKKIVTTELCLHDGKIWPAGKPLSRYCSLGGWGKDTVQKEESYLMDRFVWFLRRSFSLKVFFWSLFEVWGLFDWKHMCKWRIMSDIAEGCSSRLVVFHFLVFLHSNIVVESMTSSIHPIAISSNCKLKIPYSKLNFIYVYMSRFIRITRM